MINYKRVLKKEGITLTKFAKYLSVSRPTLYNLMERYDDGIQLEEPYQTVFDAFFYAERISMKGNYQCRNGNVIVKIIDNTAVNSNGTFVKGSETRGKRDIVVGIVIVGNENVPVNTTVYFSFFAAQPFVLEDEAVYVLNMQDIKFIKKGEEANV